MNKTKLFLDFDNCIVNATQKFCSCYNRIYRYYKDFIPAIWQDVDQWNFSDQCPLIDNVEEIFKSRMFFDDLTFINENTYEVLRELNNKYHIIIVSIGTYGNIALKSLWIDEYLPFIKDSILLVNSGSKMNKELVDMGIRNDQQHPIFIDDVVSNLNSSNAKYKICFGDIHQWNKNWDGERALNWTEVGNKLL